MLISMYNWLSNKINLLLSLMLTDQNILEKIMATLSEVKAFIAKVELDVTNVRNLVSDLHNQISVLTAQIVVLQSQIEAGTGVTSTDLQEIVDALAAVDAGLDSIAPDPVVEVEEVDTEIPAEELEVVDVEELVFEDVASVEE